MNVKKRMKKLGIRQVDMIWKLRQRGIEVQPPALSCILNGLYTFPKAKSVLAECQKILDEQERIIQ